MFGFALHSLSAGVTLANEPTGSELAQQDLCNASKDAAEMRALADTPCRGIPLRKGEQQ